MEYRSNIYFDKMDTLIHKIFKFLRYRDKLEIKKLLTEYSTLTSMPNIYSIVNRAIKQKQIDVAYDRREYISEKISDYLVLSPGSSLKIVDIGGGNGDVLNYLSKKTGAVKDQYICVETMTDWVEKYEFSHDNITYKFWNNISMDIEDHSVDVVLCMVSLHHMQNKGGVLKNTLTEIARILKYGGMLMIKEHDCNNYETRKLIEAEHEMYHVLDTCHTKEPLDAVEYMRTTVENYKSKNEWRRIISEHGFVLVDSKNRFLDGKLNDRKNITNLYWDIFVRET